jgi:hypothetical protein
MHRRTIALLAAVAVAGAVSACGSGEESPDPEQSAEVAAVVEESVAFEDPMTICAENFTEHSLESDFQGADRDARLDECSDDEPELTEIEVSEVEIDGEAATARVTGSDVLDGERADFVVVLVEDGGWKIDGFR